MEEQKKKGSSRNRVAGCTHERDEAKTMRSIGYTDIRTSRECSRKRDSQKVDLCNADEDEFGRLPYNIQCKTLCSTAPYPKLLKELEEHNSRKQINVVFHKLTKKTEGGRFNPVGKYAILNLDDFYVMMEKLLKLETFIQKSGVELEEFSNPINKKV